MREGENKIYEIEDGKKPFTDDCKEGLCKAKQVKADTYPSVAGTITVSGSDDKKEAWNRECVKEKCIDKNGIIYPGKNSGAKKDARYIIEYLSTNDADNRTVYRVTAKAWGKNENTVVMLQSYVANE